MKITKIRGIFFSGTGTTAKAVNHLTQKLSDLFEVPYEVLSINHPQARISSIPNDETTLLVFGVPVYDGRVPKFLLPYLKSDHLASKNTLAIPLCVYGNRGYDDALVELRNLLQDRGFTCVGAAAIVGQHAFAPKVGRGRPSLPDRRQLDTLAKEMKTKINELEKLPEFPIEVTGNDPVGPYNSPRDRFGYPINISKVRPKTAKEHLDTARNIIKLCPVSAIAPDGVQIPGPCMRCGACIKLSPKGAKYYDDKNMLLYKSELEIQYSAPKNSEIFF